jgi:hypothetical protein
MAASFIRGMLRGMPALVLGCGLLGSGAGFAAGNLAAPKSFVALEQHDPTGFSYALRYGQDHLKSSRNAEFEIYLAGRGLYLVVPGSNFVQPEYMKLRRANPRLKVIACAETVKLVETAARRRIPLLPGVAVQPCRERLKAMRAAGWQRAPGI